MSQVSKKHVNNDVMDRIFEIFVDLLIAVNNAEKAELFLNSLLTKTEKIVLSKRLSIAFLLANEYSADHIMYLLKVSRQTVWTVKNWLDGDGKDFLKIIKEIKNNKKNKLTMKKFFLMIEEVLTPTFTSDWRRLQSRKRLQEYLDQKPF